MSTSKPLVIVAVVEDDAPSRIALGRPLRAAGFAPALFDSAEAYLDASPAPTCIVVDVRLSGMPGIELQERLRAADSAPQIIVTNAAFFRKPVDGNALTATIALLATR